MTTTLYQDKDWKGKRLAITRNYRSLKDTTLGNHPSSIMMTDSDDAILLFGKEDWDGGVMYFRGVRKMASLGDLSAGGELLKGNSVTSVRVTPFKVRLNVSVVTKSGSNAVNGTAYGYARSDRFNAQNPLSGTTLPMDQAQFGASLGGPLVRDRTFYFANAEARRLDQTGLVTIPDASVRAINARLLAVGYPGSPVATGLYPSPVDTANALAKIDMFPDGKKFTSIASAWTGTRAGVLSGPSCEDNGASWTTSDGGDEGTNGNPLDLQRWSDDRSEKDCDEAAPLYCFEQ